MSAVYDAVLAELKRQAKRPDDWGAPYVGMEFGDGTVTIDGQVNLEELGRAMQAWTLRQFSVFLEKQARIGAETDSQHTPEDRKWWKENFQTLDAPDDDTYSISEGLFYVDTMEEAIPWLEGRAKMIESGAWSL